MIHLSVEYQYVYSKSQRRLYCRKLRKRISLEKALPDILKENGARIWCSRQHKDCTLELVAKWGMHHFYDMLIEEGFQKARDWLKIFPATSPSYYERMTAIPGEAYKKRKHVRKYTRQPKEQEWSLQQVREYYGLKDPSERAHNCLKCGHFFRGLPHVRLCKKCDARGVQVERVVQV